MDSNIGEIVCEAINTIVSKKIEDLKYNITETCVITDDTSAKIGKYIVKSDNFTYSAYSTNTTLKKNDRVLVMIPNANYDEQKIILNKISLEAELAESSAYVSPLKQMIKFTNNLVESTLTEISSEVNKKTISLLANKINTQALNPEKMDRVLMYTIDISGYQNFSKLGISAEFKSWLKDLGAVSGEYGLEFLFFDTSADYNDIENDISTYRYTFGINDFLGNPYNFSTYFTQEKLIDISNLKNLKKLKVYFYQKGNFKTEQDEYIIHSVNGQNLPNNLFVRNLEIYIGHDINDYHGDSVTINVNDSNLYFSTLRNEIKNINLYWIHELDNGNYQIINGESETTTDGININEIQAEVYWVRQDDKSDQSIMDIVGSNWIYTENEIKVDPNNKFKCELHIQGTESNGNGLNRRDNIVIKAVLRLKKNDNWEIYTSNILNFVTEDEKIDTATANAIRGLSIQCEDGNYSGTYFIYGDNNKIIDESKGSGHIKYLSLFYDGEKLTSEYMGPLKDNIESITWELYKNTTEKQLSMINFLEVPEQSEAGLIAYPTSELFLKYTISDVWYPNKTQNTVTCTIMSKNGVKYEASITLNFGKRNNNKGNYNVVIEYTDLNENAYNIQTDNNNKIINNSWKSQSLIARLYDSNGAIDAKNSDNKISWNWSFYTGTNFTLNNSTKQIADIIFDNSTTINLVENYNIVQVVCTINNETKITAYKPIAIKTFDANNNPRADALSGSPEIVYNSFGQPLYNNNPYYLLRSDKNDTSVITWELKSATSKGAPSLKTIEDTVALVAHPVYDSTITYQTCLSAKNENSIIYWSQPILIMQSANDISIIDNWENINYGLSGDDSEVKASAITAGTLIEIDDNHDPVFQGILLGNITSEGTGERNGLFGVNHGNISFELNSNGSAEFEKKSMVEGTSKEIEITTMLGSLENYLDSKILNEDTVTEESSLRLDLDKQSLEFNGASSVGVSGLTLSSLGTENSPYLLLYDDSVNLVNFRKNNFYLQSSNYSASNATGLRFDIKNGIINLPGNNTIGGTSSLLSIGDLKITNSGEVQYKNQTLENYIKSIIEEYNSQE